MTAILVIGVCVLAWKLMQANRRQQIAYTRYMDDRVVQPAQPHYMVGPDGQQRPMWCPNCGRNL